MYLSRIYPNETPPRHAWRLKVDLKERLLLTTHRSPGLKVHDLDSMAELFVIQTVGPYTHLEYDPDAGIAVFDEDDDLEIWKLQKPSPGQDLSDFARGQFVKWNKIPAIPGMRGFHLKDGILAVVSQQGTTTYYDLVTSPDQPTLLQTLSHDRGAIGYLDKTPSTLVLCHDDLTRCYSPLNGSLLGTFPPPPTVFLAHYTIRRPEARRGLDELVSTDVVYTGMIESVDFEEIRPAAFYGGKEWKACHVDGPYLVILSDMSRLFVCTDYEAVLRALEGEERERIMKSTCCVFDIEVGEINLDADPGMERYTGDTNWLSVCDGRAAFGAIDHVMILPLPPKSSTAYVKSPHALALPTARDMEISCLSLVPDGLFTIWGYLQRTSSSPGYHRMILRNAVRVLWFDGRGKKIESEDRELALEKSATEIQMEAEGWTASDDDGEEWTDDDGVEEWTDEEDG
ncbi:WD40/YVTN repeat-like-containing domain [Phaffia rhodozyma]|uniref:WD40/YVTN repeat-like-containing domain n=1 Tax=Phaffia rhodozyma TaxID=264483 RepID=A0A0F7SN23_PHARH|nr:WD40/YVTN repeat-like-containing domain [Phaffia rhodozyma]